MRVHIVIYDPTNSEGALSGWVVTRTMTHAKDLALGLAQDHRSSVPHDCKLRNYMLSRKDLRSGRMKAYLTGLVPNGQPTSVGAHADSLESGDIPRRTSHG